MTEWDIFVAALDIENPAERAGFLKEACAGKTDLQQRVEELLKVQDELAGFLSQPAELTTNLDSAETQDYQSSTEQSYQRSAERSGDRIGPYTLMKLLGQGGMGAVWLAEQTEPVKRQVALKLIRTGLNVGDVIARFGAERQALALMNHPNVAKIHDAGMTPTGQPYFAMELVEGLPLSNYCDRERLTIRERLELFLPICRAVQHAHQKGLIHRDLKPTNIIVGVHDGKPVPKVIDFGIAKATGPEITGETLHTAAGAIIGTPEYMAPEQADPDNADIDTRADIYSLGVILYELLAGSPPFSRRQPGITFFELLRLIREEEPPKPSTKLSTAPELPSLAAARKSEPKRLTGQVRGELDWIVMKCLEKDRNRRYETANGLAMDIERYLTDEPVLAGPPSKMYRVKKFVRRNKGGVVAASVISLLLTGGIVGTTWGMLRAAENLAYAKKGNELLSSVFAGLDPKANYANVGEFSQALKANLSKAVIELEGSAIGDPLTVADMQNTLGLSLFGLGGYEQSIELHSKALATREARLGSDHPVTLQSMSNLAQGYDSAGQLDKALPLFEEVLRLTKAKLGADHPDTLISMNNLACGFQSAGRFNKALPLFEEVLRLTKAKLGADHSETLRSMNNLADGYSASGQVDRALPLYEETLRLVKVKLGAEHPYTLRTMHNLASVYNSVGQRDEALPLLEETLRLQKAKLGADHPDTLTSMNALANVYHSTGQLGKALPVYEETLRLKKAKLGTDHPSTLQSMGSLAAGYHSARQIDKALALSEETLKACEAKLGADHPDTLTSMSNLALCYKSAGDLNKALRLNEETLRLKKAKLGADHPSTLTSINNLANSYRAADQLDKALPLYEEMLPLRKAKLGADHPDTLGSMYNLAGAYRDVGELEKALLLFEETLRLMKAKLGTDHPTTMTTTASLGGFLHQMRRSGEAMALFDVVLAALEIREYQHQNAGPFIADALKCFEETAEWVKAESWRRKWLGHVREKSGVESPAYAAALAGLGGNLMQQTKYGEAEAVLRDSLEVREMKEPDAWTTFNTKSMLGEAVFQLARSTSKEGDPENPARAAGYQEAEKLLLAGYDGMKQRQDKFPQEAKVRLNEAVERLIQLYDAWNKPDEAAKWRKEMEQLKVTEKKPVEKEKSKD